MKTIANIIHKKTLTLRIRDYKGRQIYFENSFGSWVKWGYDCNGRINYRGDSSGHIRDNR